MLPDASLGELLNAWDTIIPDMEAIRDSTPAGVADQIAADFEELRDELTRRERLTRLADALCMGHDGCMLLPPG